MLDILINRAAFLNRAHDRAKVVIRQDHIRGFLGNIRAGNTHRDADIRFFQGGGIIDTVAGHRDHIAKLLERGDDS